MPALGDHGWMQSGISAQTKACPQAGAESALFHLGHATPEILLWQSRAALSGATPNEQAKSAAPEGEGESHSLGTGERLKLCH